MAKVKILKSLYATHSICNVVGETIELEGEALEKALENKQVEIELKGEAKPKKEKS